VTSEPRRPFLVPHNHPGKTGSSDATVRRHSYDILAKIKIQVHH